MTLKKSLLYITMTLSLTSCGWVWDTIYPNSPNDQQAAENTDANSNATEVEPISNPASTDTPVSNTDHLNNVADNINNTNNSSGGTSNNTTDNTTNNTTDNTANNVADNSGTPTDTGSTNIADESPALLAQGYHPRYYRGGMEMPVYSPVVVMLQGENSSTVIKLDIKEPPPEISPCYRGTMLGNGIPIVDKEHHYKSWWLMASKTPIENPHQTKLVYFYWATQISEHEIGIVPTDFSTDKINSNNPQNAKIDIGFATLPYQWISRLEFYQGFPSIDDEECTKIG